MASLPVMVFHFWDRKNVALHLKSLQQRITTFHRLDSEEGRYLKPAHYSISGLNFSNTCTG